MTDAEALDKLIELGEIFAGQRNSPPEWSGQILNLEPHIARWHIAAQLILLKEVRAGSAPREETNP